MDPGRSSSESRLLVPTLMRQKLEMQLTSPDEVNYWMGIYPDGIPVAVFGNPDEQDGNPIHLMHGLWPSDYEVVETLAERFAELDEQACYLLANAGRRP